MAQLDEGGVPACYRVRLVLRQRPLAFVAAALALGAIAGACVFGVATAQGDAAGVVIECGSAGSSDAGPSDGEEDAAGASAYEDPKAATLVVDVAGAVASPGVVEVAEGDRVHDAIERAGGLAEDADVSSLNRAAILTDGQKVYVPRQGETTVPGASGPGTAQAADGSTLVNINTADEAALDGLPGVGPSTASDIIEDRDANGPFSSPEDLMRVSGIGEKKFEKLKSSICV